jgi:hypothetical protein
MNKRKTEIDVDGNLKLVDLEAEEPPTDGPADFTVPDEEETYSGRERRRAARRKGADRRKEIRFDKDKSNRRSGKDRRKGTWDTKYRV